MQSSIDAIDGELTVIGRGLTITGDRIEISAEAALLVDGAVEGDVRAVHITIGLGGCVQGTVSAESVDVIGRVNGAILGRDVTLRSSAKVNGDIHHQSLVVETGAAFDGRATRPDDADPANVAAHVGIQRQ